MADFALFLPSGLKTSIFSEVDYGNESILDLKSLSNFSFLEETFSVTLGFRPPLCIVDLARLTGGLAESLTKMPG